jgi:hypothetical protein
VKKPDRYEPRARSIGGPWTMVKCKDGPYVDYDQHEEIVAALKAEVERLTDALNKLTNTPANADGVDVKVNFWTKGGTRLPSSFQTFWMHDSAKEGRDAK